MITKRFCKLQCTVGVLFCFVFICFQGTKLTRESHGMVLQFGLQGFMSLLAASMGSGLQICMWKLRQYKYPDLNQHNLVLVEIAVFVKQSSHAETGSALHCHFLNRLPSDNNPHLFFSHCPILGKLEIHLMLETPI